MKETNTFVRAIHNLPPMDSLFEKARMARVTGTQAKNLCSRLAEYVAKPDHNAIHDLLQNQPLTQADLCRKISSVVDDFLLQFPDVPPGSSEFQTSCAAFINSFNGNILLKLFEALESDFAEKAAAIGTTLRDTFDAGGGVFTGPSADTVALCETYIGQAGPALSTLKKSSKEFTAYCIRHRISLEQPVISLEHFEASQTILDFLEATMALNKFTVNGRLQIEEARLQQAVSTMGPVMKAHQQCSSIKVHDEASKEFLKVIGETVFPWVTSLANELHAPLETQFFDHVFQHKFFEEPCVSAYSHCVCASELICHACS